MGEKEGGEGITHSICSECSKAELAKDEVEEEKKK